MAEFSILVRDGQLAIPKELLSQLGWGDMVRLKASVVGKKVHLRKVALTLGDIEGSFPALNPDIDPDEVRRILNEERVERWLASEKRSGSSTTESQSVLATTYCDKPANTSSTVRKPSP